MIIPQGIESWVNFEQHNRLMAKSIIEALSGKDLELLMKISENPLMPGINDQLPFRMQKMDNWKFDSTSSFLNIVTYADWSHNVDAFGASFEYLITEEPDVTQICVLLSFSITKDISESLRFFDNHNLVTKIRFVCRDHPRLMQPDQAQEVISIHQNQYPDSKIQDVIWEGDMNQVWRQTVNEWDPNLKTAVYIWGSFFSLSSIQE